MKNQRMKIKTMVVGWALLTIVAATVSAQQWESQPAPQYAPSEANLSDMPALDVQTVPNTPTAFAGSDAADEKNVAEGRNQSNQPICKECGQDPDANSVVEGQIYSMNANGLASAEVDAFSILLVRQGKIAYQTRTGFDGSFWLDKVKPGPYSFVAAGPDGFVAYGVNIRSNPGEQESNWLEAAAASTNIGGIQQILHANLPAEVAAEIMQEKSMNWQEVKDADGDVSESNRVRLVGGQLTGRIVDVYGENQGVQGTIVNLVQNGRRVAKVQVDERGFYTFSNLQPGVYDFIAVGNKGLAAIRFVAVAQDTPMTKVAYRRTPELVPTSLDMPLTIPLETSVVDQSEGNLNIHDAPGSIEYSQPSVNFGGATGGFGNSSFDRGDVHVDNSSNGYPVERRRFRVRRFRGGYGGR